MAKIVLTLDTETGLVNVDNQSELVAAITGGANGHMMGQSAKAVITGWQLFITLGQTPEEKARETFTNAVLKWKGTQEEALRRALDEDGVSMLEPLARNRVEGAIEMCDQLLKDIG